MLDNLAIAPSETACLVDEISIQPVFTQEEEQQKREEYLLKNPSVRMATISAAVTFAERNLPAHMRNNKPRTKAEC